MFYTKIQKGFTLIEMLVAVLILSLVLGVGFSVIGGGLLSLFTARNQVTAFYLAQDAVEGVKNIRDTNAVNRDDWLSGINCANECTIDVFYDPTASTLSIPRIENGVTNKKLYQAGDGRYAHIQGDVWTETDFSRTLTITEIESDREIRVDVTVGYGNDKELSISEHIFNWR